MKRKEQRQLWLADYFKATEFKSEAASEDASFRSYYRVTTDTETDNNTFILMDAPPKHEDCRPFVAVLQLLSANQVNVPELFATDFDNGFLLLGDFGDQLYLATLDESADSHESLYQAAIDTMLNIQSITAAETQLPPYDDKLLMTEMQLFTDWFIGKHLGLKLDAAELTILNHAFALLSNSALQQPQVMVHRDYHSRNLMVIAETQRNNQSPGVIDFQDAVYGPFTYDLASLLKDCYISWPVETVEQHCQYFLNNYNKLFNASIELPQLTRWFELMAAQRHLKAIGIFCRLNYRDRKAGYLNDIPRTMNYLLATAAKYPELAAFSQLLQAIQPVLPNTSIQ